MAPVPWRDELRDAVTMLMGDDPEAAVMRRESARRRHIRARSAPLYMISSNRVGDYLPTVAVASTHIAAHAQAVRIGMVLVICWMILLLWRAMQGHRRIKSRKCGPSLSGEIGIRPVRATSRSHRLAARCR